MIPVITIDGPSSSGKGTISKLLAEKLGWYLLDSGAIYRVLALAVIRKNIPLTDIQSLVFAAQNLRAKFVEEVGLPQKIILDDDDVTQNVRSENCGVIASKIAAIPVVREALISFQKSFCKLPGLVADGRDMGTVIFPDACLKIFLTASAKSRAKRRLLQLKERGINARLIDVLRDLEERDARDLNREVAPLKPASFAVIIDTTKLSINEVLQEILEHVRKTCNYN